MTPEQIRRKAVKAGFHRGVRREEVAGTRHLERHLKRLPRRFHEIQGSFQDGEGRVAFVQMAHFGIKPQRAQEPPAADAQHDFLDNAHLRAATI